MTKALRQVKHSLIAVFTRTWPLSILMILVGIVLMIVGESWHLDGVYLKALPKLLEHMGVAFAVAALVGMLFHLHEFSEFFKSLAAATLTEDDYLHKLNKDALRTLRVNAVNAIMASGEVVDNPGYDSDHLVRSLDDMLFNKLLPGGSVQAGVYRQDLVTQITLEYMTLAEALNDVSVPSANVPKADLASPLIKQTTTTSYKVVLPRIGDIQRGYMHRAGMWCACADIPYFPLEHRGKFRIGHTDQMAQQTEVTYEQKEGRVTLTAHTEIRLNPDESTVWSEIVEYRSLGTEPFILNVMNMLTRNIDVSVDYRGARALTFFGAAFGLSDDVKVTYVRGGGGVRFRIPGWLLENHGYFVWWWEQNGATARHEGGWSATAQQAGLGKT